MGVFKNEYDQVRSGWLILLLAIMIIFFQLLLIIPFMEFGGTSSSPMRSFATGITMEIAIFLGVVFMWMFVQKNPLGEIGLRGNSTGWKDVFWGLGFALSGLYHENPGRTRKFQMVNLYSFLRSFLHSPYG